VDNTVALVQAYLHVTGYFTVAEYPIVAVNRRGEARGVTDIDLMAWRFPGAVRGCPAGAAPSVRPCKGPTRHWPVRATGRIC
jgi:hypothetical protein